MRTRAALLLVVAIALFGGLFVRAPSRADELRVAQATGPASTELVARGRELFNDVGVSADGRWNAGEARPDSLFCRARWSIPASPRIGPPVAPRS